MSTIKPKIGVGQRRAMTKRHGKPFSRKNLAQLLTQPCPNQGDALLLGETAARLRLQVREMIRDYRQLERHWHMLHTELEYLNIEMEERKSQISRPGFGRIQGLYAVYRLVWRDFLYALDWAAKLQNLDAAARKDLSADLRDRARQQARRQHRAEKASQLACALLTRSRKAGRGKERRTAL